MRLRTNFSIFVLTKIIVLDYQIFEYSHRSYIELNEIISGFISTFHVITLIDILVQWDICATPCSMLHIDFSSNLRKKEKNDLTNIRKMCFLTNPILEHF